MKTPTNLLRAKADAIFTFFPFSPYPRSNPLPARLALQGRGKDEGETGFTKADRWTRAQQMPSRKHLHRVGDPGLINSIELLGLSRRLENNRFVLTVPDLFPDRQKHIDMLFVRRAMCLPVREIIPREPQIFYPKLAHTRRMAAAEIGEQTVILIPFCHSHGSQTFEPLFLLAHPPPGVQRRGRARNRLGIQNILGGQADRFPLANDQIQVAMLGVLIANHLLVLMRENFLLYPQHRAITGNIRPAVPAMANVKRQLLEKQSRSRPCDRHGIIALQLWRRHRFTRQLAEGSLPAIGIHSSTSYSCKQIFELAQGHGQARFFLASRS